MEFISNSLKDTDLIAKKLAFKIKKNLENNIINYIIFLDGDLGAGKTTFTRSLVKYLGSSDNVCSPTFALVNQYKSFVDIFHFDMYRIENPDDLYSIGFFDYINNNNILIIEWGKNIIEFLAEDIKNIININLEYIDNNSRKIMIDLDLDGDGDDNF